MKIEIQKINSDAVPAALERAKHYRLLNEPHQAESICLDILEVEPGHHEAQVVLLLALSDQFAERLQDAFTKAKTLADNLGREYDRAYYLGIVYERRGRSLLQKGGLGIGTGVYEWLVRALESYREASKLSPHDNDDAVLRWNTCVRMIENNPTIQPEREEQFHPMLE